MSNTKISKDFDIREFVPEETWSKWGMASRWFVPQSTIDLAQFYKDWFTDYFKSKDKEVTNVSVIINNWMWNGKFGYRGYRPPNAYINGQFKSNPLSESLHRQGNAFDCNIVVNYKNGDSEWITQGLLHKIIHNHWKDFKEAGLTTLEDPKIAKTWLHSDTRNTGSNELLIVGA